MKSLISGTIIWIILTLLIEGKLTFPLLFWFLIIFDVIVEIFSTGFECMEYHKKLKGEKIYEKNSNRSFSNDNDG